MLLWEKAKSDSNVQCWFCSEPLWRHGTSEQWEWPTRLLSWTPLGISGPSCQSSELSLWAPLFYITSYSVHLLARSVSRYQRSLREVMFWGEHSKDFPYKPIVTASLLYTISTLEGYYHFFLRLYRQNWTFYNLFKKAKISVTENTVTELLLFAQL